MKHAAAAAALLLWTPAFLGAGDFRPQGGGSLSATDRWGNLITVTNRFDGSSYYVQVTSFVPNRGVNWDRVHGDGYQESAHAVTLDGDGDVYVAGTRASSGAKYFWLMKYSNAGALLWERVDSTNGCSAFNAISNESGDVWAAGSCRIGTAMPAHLVRYDAAGNYVWGQLYDEGGRNYVRGLSLDIAERSSMTMEVMPGSFGGGASLIRTVVYDRSGYRVTVY